MVASRELAITSDKFAYHPDEIAVAITNGFASTTDNITYASGKDASPAFRSVRVNSFSDAANRDVIIEESIDQVAAAAIYGGTYGASGNFETAFRGYDFSSSGLLEAAMGTQSTEFGTGVGAVNSPTTTPGTGRKHNAGKWFNLTMIPYPIALKVVDEQATATGVAGSTTIYRGVGINNFELTLAVKDYAKASFGWMARKAEVYDYYKNTSGTIQGDPSVFYNAVLKWTPTNTSTTETMKCKSFTMTLSRTMDQDYFFIGSEFLQGLYYNGLTDLGGSITLGSGDWLRIRTMMTGAVVGGVNTLDSTKVEFLGKAADSTVLANAIPSGKFEIILHYPDGTNESACITCTTAKLTEMNRSVQGRNQFEKTVTWKAQINATDTFSIEVYS